MTRMTASEIQSLLTGSDHPPIINVLDEDHYRARHIPGTINIPLNEDHFVNKVEQQVNGKDNRVVVYCASADCDASERAATKLEEAGFTSVIDFEGGTEQWEQAGYQIEGSKANRSQHTNQPESATR